MTKTYTGRCLCGAITFIASGPAIVVARCHCDACRRSSGAGHSAGAMFPAEAVTLTGPLHTYTYTSDANTQVTKATCPTCASPMYGRNTSAPGHLTVPLGAFDDTTGLNIEIVIFEGKKPHWEALGPDVAIYVNQPAWKPPT